MPPGNEEEESGLREPGSGGGGGGSGSLSPHRAGGVLGAATIVGIQCKNETPKRSKIYECRGVTERGNAGVGEKISKRRRVF